MVTDNTWVEKCQIMVKLRSGSTTDYSTMGTDMNPDHFILCLAAALKLPDIVGQL